MSFGGSGGVQTLHPLERPFTDADGQHIMSKVITITIIRLGGPLPDDTQDRAHLGYVVQPTKLAICPDSILNTYLLQLRFDQDNTINDRPMVNVVTTLDGMLEASLGRAGAAAAGAPLHQLVLIIADGRYGSIEYSTARSGVR